EEPASGTFAARLAYRVDRMMRTRRTELLDKAWLPDALKSQGMRLLERINERIGAYELWAREVAEALDGLASANIYELASGLGGFALHLATHAPNGTQWTVRGSDVNETYLSAASKLATGVPRVRFER